MDRIRYAPERFFHSQPRMIRQPGAQGFEGAVFTRPSMAMPSMMPFRRSLLFRMSVTRASIEASVGVLGWMGEEDALAYVS